MTFYPKKEMPQTERSGAFTAEYLVKQALFSISCLRKEMLASIELSSLCVSDMTLSCMIVPPQ